MYCLVRKNMIEINVRSQINSPIDKVWNIISNVDDDPKYWKNIESIKNTSKEGNVVTREIVVNKDQICNQKITLYPKERIRAKWLKGTISGTRDILLISLGKVTLIEVQMAYTMPRISSKGLVKELRNEAESAVELIRKKSESDFLSVSTKPKQSSVMV